MDLGTAQSRAVPIVSNHNESQGGVSEKTEVEVPRDLRVDEESVLPGNGSPAAAMELPDNGASSDTETVFANKVPGSERRGLFANFCVLAEVDEPRNYPRRTKWFITFIIAAAAAAASLGSAIILPSLSQAANDLHASTTVTNLSVALFMLSMSIFPLWWAHLSESLGRRTIYLVSFVLFVVFAILSAISTTVGMLVAMRMLAGGAAASVQAVGAGTIADLWESRERGKAMSFFYIGPLCGPLFAPIIGGALGQRWDWRATQWFLVIYGGLVLLFLMVALPETLRQEKVIASEEIVDEALERVSTAKSVQNKAVKWVKLAQHILLDPLAVVLYLRFPPILLTVYYASIAFGSLYLLNISLQDVFARAPYNFSTAIVGLVYIPSSIGFLVTSFFCGKWSDVIMEREAIKAKRYDENGKLIYRPEDRMKENALIAAVLFPGSMIWYGWTADKGVYWIVPLLANFFFGVGTMIIFTMASTMLTEFMHRKPATGVAVNNFMRNIFSCTGAVVGDPLVRALGNGWLFTGLGVIAAFSGGVLWAMKRYGPRWREQLDSELK